MKYFILLSLVFSSLLVHAQSFQKDTLHIEWDGKEYHYIIGETTAAEIMKDFPEMKLKVKNVRAFKDREVVVSLGNIKTEPRFSFMHNARKKSEVSLEECKLSYVFVRPMSGLVINGFPCSISTKEELDALNFDADTSLVIYRKSASIYSNSQNYGVHLTGSSSSARVKQLFFSESSATQIKNQNIYLEWRKLQDSIDMCSATLQLALNIPEMDSYWLEDEKQLIIQDQNLIPREVSCEKFNAPVLVRKLLESKEQQLENNLVILKFEVSQGINAGGVEIPTTCLISYHYEPTKTRADVRFKWNGVTWEVTKTEVHSMH